MSQAFTFTECTIDGEPCVEEDGIYAFTSDGICTEVVNGAVPQ